MNNEQVFLTLLKAGLWCDVKINCFSQNDIDSAKLKAVPKGRAVGLRLSDFPMAIDYNEVLRFAEEQSVVGLITAGLEKLPADKLPLTKKLIFAGYCHLIEQRNEVMNRFIAELIAKMKAEGIKAVLVKGHGVAQCYERPQWRSAGDIDLLLDNENYNKAKAFLSPFSEESVVEDVGKKHLSVQINGFTIELHGRMPFALSRRSNRVIDEVVADTLLKVSDDRLTVRVWKNGDTDVYLPNADNDVILVFTHYLHHFFIEGVGLKQICDWCRLLWKFRDELDKELLGKRLREMGLMSEWKVFASLAVNRLGMPQEAMPFFDESSSCRRKANRVLRRMMKSGNLGHNNDVSYRARHTAFLSNAITFFRRMADFAKFSFVFPMDSPRFFMTYVTGRIKNA